MYVTKRHILNIINGNMLSPDEMADAILEKSKHQASVVHRLEKIKADRSSQKKKHEAAMKKLDEEAQEIYAQCDHEWQTNGDPSGGTDRDTHCTICGLQK